MGVMIIKYVLGTTRYVDLPERLGSASLIRSNRDV